MEVKYCTHYNAFVDAYKLGNCRDIIEKGSLHDPTIAHQIVEA